MVKTLLLTLVAFGFNIYPQNISSPDGRLSLNFNVNEKGKITYKLFLNKKEVIKESELGIELKDQPGFTDGFSVEKIDTSTFYEEWAPVWGEVSNIINNFRV